MNNFQSGAGSPTSKAFDFSIRRPGTEHTYQQFRGGAEMSEVAGKNNTGNGSSVHVLFLIRNFTYVEIRDCCVISKNKSSVMDAAFLMNELDLCSSSASPQL
jgi:hypothetical protein